MTSHHTPILQSCSGNTHISLG